MEESEESRIGCHHLFFFFSMSSRSKPFGLPSASLYQPLPEPRLALSEYVRRKQARAVLDIHQPPAGPCRRVEGGTAIIDTFFGCLVIFPPP